MQVCIVAVLLKQLVGWGPHWQRAAYVRVYPASKGAYIHAHTPRGSEPWKIVSRLCYLLLLMEEKNNKIITHMFLFMELMGRASITSFLG
jgi:hypothetical protein